MTRSKKTLRLAMLGVLCAGLLMMGIGAGVAFAEYSSFTYAGVRVPDQAQTQEQSFTAVLDPEAKQLRIYGGGSYLSDQLLELARLEVNGDLEPGTVRLDLRYRSVGPRIHASWAEGDAVRLYWSGGYDMELLMSCKDQLLEDIRSRQIGDYVPVQLTEAVITVNPADAEKVTLD